jgi:hypothetical protein
MGASILDLGVGGGRVTASAENIQTVEDGESKEDSPEEETESGRGSGNATTSPNSERDGAGEPEEHGDGVEGEAGDLVVDTDKEDGEDADVEQDQQGPDTVEDHEGHKGRSVAVEAPPLISIEDIGNPCGESELDDGEHGRDGVEDGEDAECHCASLGASQA